MWFSLVCCPHYSAEVCIYACLCLLSAPISPSYASAPFSSFSPFSPISVSASAPLCLLLWVCANLAVVGQRQLCWYKGAFPQAFAQGGAKQHWAAICPGLC
ncbi:hypothetical protein B484DRAFT_458062 [Ochromonadaceae sp. CCMP2298]|nr:hypothetical protein B484DRAFT_458062 [Ochromonadaceae sp. CCMP2298]